MLKQKNTQVIQKRVKNEGQIIEQVKSSNHMLITSAKIIDNYYKFKLGKYSNENLD